MSQICTSGNAVAVGDFDGDDVDDILVGAYHASAAYVVRGPVWGEMDLSVADAKLVGEETSDQAGTAIASGDETMLRVFSDPRGDIYRYVAARMLRKPEAGVTGAERQKARPRMNAANRLIKEWHPMRFAPSRSP